MMVDAAGKLLRFLLRPGQAHDITQGEALVEGFVCKRIIADRGYAAKDFVDGLLEKGIEVAIPPHLQAKERRACDKRRYRERNLVERFISRPKHFRRVFSRFEKLDTPHLGFLRLVGVMIWLRSNVNTT